jgi:LPXTG-motif cell wall-anchored protein
MADAETESKRAELARTIDAISDRVSPKKNVDRAVDQIRQRASQIDPIMAGAAAAAVVVALAAFVLLRRRRKH